MLKDAHTIELLIDDFNQPFCIVIDVWLPRNINNAELTLNLLDLLINFSAISPNIMGILRS